MLRAVYPLHSLAPTVAYADERPRFYIKTIYHSLPLGGPYKGRHRFPPFPHLSFPVPELIKTTSTIPRNGNGREPDPLAVVTNPVYVSSSLPLH